MSVHQLPRLQREIVIRTPENIELHFALAGAGSRAAAYFIDLMLMAFVGQMLINVIAYLLTVLMQAFSTVSELWAGAIALLLGFALYNGYFIFFEWVLNGQTPGKRLLHIRVIKEGGYALRFFDTLLRNLLRTIDFIPAFYGVGLVSLLVTRHCQRLGDLVAGTLVVHQDPVETQSLMPDLGVAADAAAALPAGQLAAVPAEVLSVASRFMIRRGELAPRARQEVAAELVDLVRRASGVGPPPGQSAENFLAAVLTQAEQTALSSSPPPPLPV